MTIIVGGALPDVALFLAQPEGPSAISTGSLFADKKAVLFALPGAFTPTCSARHLPGFVEKAAAFKEQSVDFVACLSVNDAFVMMAWSAKHDATNSITMIADGNGEFVRALGLERDMAERGMGVRSQRFAMVVEDGVVQNLFIDSPGGYGVSSAENVLIYV